MNKELCIIGLNYKTAPVEVRERFALTDPEVVGDGLTPLDDAVRECMILSTCNRVEVLAVAGGEECTERLLVAWAAKAGESVDRLRPYVYEHKGEAAVRHLFAVASSLESMVLGEPQILGQLKDAYRTALEKDSAKVILGRLLHKSFSVAKRVRSETAIASSAVSISYAAVELAKRIFGDMRGTSAMLIGAGEMAELAAANLVNAGIQSIRVANRTTERAVQLAAQFNGEAIPFDALFEHLAHVDIVISSTGAHEPIISAEAMKPVLRKRKNKPMFLIDIAVPRDIDPSVNTLDNIYLYDIDDLREVVEENLANRKEEAVKAFGIVEEETGVFCRWLRSLDLQPTLADVVHKGEQIAKEEVERTLKRLGPLSPEQQDAIAAMAASIVKKIHHEPITFLKQHFDEEDAGMQLVSTVRRLFNLDRETTPENAHFGRGSGRNK